MEISGFRPPHPHHHYEGQKYPMTNRVNNKTKNILLRQNYHQFAQLSPIYHQQQ